MKSFNKVNVIIVLVSTVLASIISVGTITIFLNRYLNKPDINIQFCDSKENLILIKQPIHNSAVGRFRLALQIVNNSDMTYNNILCEYSNLSILETGHYYSKMEFNINDLYTDENIDLFSADKYPDSITALNKITSKFIPVETITIHPGILPMKKTFMANIKSNYAPIMFNQTFVIGGDSSEIDSCTKINNRNNGNPMPIIEHRLAIRISGDDYPQRIYYLTIYFGREETLSYFNRPIFEIDSTNNFKLRLIQSPVN